MNASAPRGAPGISRSRLGRHLALLAICGLAAAALVAPTASAASGAIWTTQETCQTPADQDANHYAVGETVHIRGANFDANTAFSWTITGQPGGSSSDPGIVVASGDSSTDGSGAFCLTAYTVLPGDDGEYTVDVTLEGAKNDNYRVEGVQATATPPPATPTPPAATPTPPAATPTPPAATPTPPAATPTLPSTGSEKPASPTPSLPSTSTEDPANGSGGAPLTLLLILLGTGAAGLVFLNPLGKRTR